MKLKTLRDVLGESVRDLYSAEKQLLKALPKMAKAAGSPDLKAAFTAHLEETRGQAERLEKVCESLGVKAGGKKCKAMEGLIEEAKELLEEDATPQARDAALIEAAQKVEHYEIAGYGSARTFAQVLGEAAVVKLLQQTLDEEKRADEKLSTLAETGLNEMAAAVEPEEKPAKKRKAAGR